MKLNIGCGNRRMDGYVGVDAVRRDAADIVAPAKKIPVADGLVEEIIAVHLWEHFYVWECDEVITEWRRLLCDGGRLVLELPNIVKCAQNLLEGKHRAGKDPNQLHMWGLYGDPRGKDPYMAHRWGWSPETLKQFLKQHGFNNIVEVPTQFHLVGRNHRDMRIEAVK